MGTILISWYVLRETLRATVLLAVLALAAPASCGSESRTTPLSSTPAGGPLVVATTSIWGDVASNVVGDDGHVTVLIPIGTDAHEYQPSPRDAALLLDADLVVANGLLLEEGLSDVIAAAGADRADVIELAPLLDPIPLGDDHAVDAEDGLGGEDPHVWLDPLRVADGARVIAEELMGRDDRVDWSARAATYAAQLEEADTQIESLLADIPPDRRKLVTNHEALGYFASRYDFEIVGVVIPGGSTLAEPSSAELSALVELIERERVAAVFAETSSPSALAEAVAAEIDGVDIVELYTESIGEPGSGADSVIGMLLTNAQRIAGALS